LGGQESNFPDTVMVFVDPRSAPAGYNASTVGAVAAISEVLVTAASKAARAAIT
jgi:hypothetical protein